MKIVLDTNVLLSGIFWRGAPYKVLRLWQEDKISLAISLEIADEYSRSGEKLATKYKSVVAAPIIVAVIAGSEVILAPPLPVQVCEDPDDDKFIACALAAKADAIITGDKKLLACNDYKGLEILTPNQFLKRL